MALTVTRKFEDTFLDYCDKNGEHIKMHIFDPDYHQNKYVKACSVVRNMQDSFLVGDKEKLKVELHRGKQPHYVDDENDANSLLYEGMMLTTGEQVRREANDITLAVCALKSNCIRNGYIDFNLARSVSYNFYKKNKNKCGVKKNDILVNSTGDGSIGRVAVYNYDFPAVVDGHITIIRYKDENLAWYVAASLLSENGQNQIYRYINGSSGQVEIYPQDIGRIWIKPATSKRIEEICKSFKDSCVKHDEFYRDLMVAINMV